MTKFAFDSSWNQIKGKLQQRFGQLTDNDVLFIEGKGDELIGRLQAKLGIGEDALNDLLGSLQRETSGGVNSATSALNSARSAASSALQTAQKRVEDYAGDLAESASQNYDSALRSTKTLQADTEDYVRKNPFAVVLAAALAGFVIAFLFRRR